MRPIRTECMIEIDYAAERHFATRDLRNALRDAYRLSNKSGTYAADTELDGTRGVHGLIEDALRLMGDGQALEDYWVSAEWPSN